MEDGCENTLSGRGCISVLELTEFLVDFSKTRTLVIAPVKSSVRFFSVANKHRHVGVYEVSQEKHELHRRRERLGKRSNDGSII